KLHVDWNSLDAAAALDVIKIAAEKEKLLEPLITNELEGKALMSIVVAFTRRNQTVMDLLALRRTEAVNERTQVNLLLRQAMSNTTNAMAEARRTAQRLPK